MWGIGKATQWDEIDLLLVEALSIHESGVCKGCGHPLMFTTADDVHPRDFIVTSMRCAGCSALKDEPATDKPLSGQMFYVINNRSSRY